MRPQHQHPLHTKISTKKAYAAGPGPAYKQTKRQIAHDCNINTGTEWSEPPGAHTPLRSFEQQISIHRADARACTKTIDTTRHTRTRDLKPQARIRTRPKPCTRACAAPSPASASVSICRERLGLVQDFDSQCSFIVPDHEDPIRHLRQGATQLVLCFVASATCEPGCCRLPSHRFWSATDHGSLRI